MVIAAISFMQGLSTGAAGVAMLGVKGVPVSCRNGNDTGVVSRTWTFKSVPLGSALPVGDIVTTETFQFTPDADYCYLVRLVVTGADGSVAFDERVFGVPDAQGCLIPAFEGAGTSHNFPGNTRGWAGTDAVKMVDWMLANAGGGGSLPSATNYQHLEYDPGAGAWAAVSNLTLPKADGGVRVIAIEPTTDDANAGLLYIHASDAAASYARNGGEVDIYGGRCGGLGGSGGSIYVYGGRALTGTGGSGGNFEAGAGDADSTGAGVGGEVYINAGRGGDLNGGVGGPCYLYAGNGFTAGFISLRAGSCSGGGRGGDCTVEGGQGSPGGNVTLVGGLGGTGGNAIVQGGEGSSTGGDAILLAGTCNATPGTACVYGYDHPSLGSDCWIIGGDGTAAGGTGGNAWLLGGLGAGVGGQATVQAGDGGTGGGGACGIGGGNGTVGGVVDVRAGNGSTGAGGDAKIYGGTYNGVMNPAAIIARGGTDTTGGNIELTPGEGNAASTQGIVLFGNLSVTNPNGIFEIRANTLDAIKPGLRWDGDTAKWQLCGLDGIWHDISFT